MTKFTGLEDLSITTFGAENWISKNSDVCKSFCMHTFTKIAHFEFSITGRVNTMQFTQQYYDCINQVKSENHKVALEIALFSRRKRGSESCYFEN